MTTEGARVTVYAVACLLVAAWLLLESLITVWEMHDEKRERRKRRDDTTRRPRR